MTEPDERGDALHAASAAPGASAKPPPVPSMTAWGKRAALLYLCLGALSLAAMVIETVMGHPGTCAMFAAFLSVPWSMIVAGLAPPLPANLPLAAGLAVRMVPLALFMLLNAAIIAGIAARSERDVSGSGRNAAMLVLLAGLLSPGCSLSSSQRVLVAAPAVSSQFFSGGVVTTIFEFDLSTVPEWRDHRSRLREVTGLSLLGDFRNVDASPLAVPPLTGAAIDVRIWLAPESNLLPLPAQKTEVWGPLRLESGLAHRVEWTEGAQHFTAASVALRREILGDGRFGLIVESVLAPGASGGALVENLRIGATLEVK
jgi:hypothetical protein